MFQYILWMEFLLALIKITRGISITPYKNTTQCGNLTCVNNAKCKGDGLSCMCQRGYQGTNCSEDWDECNFGDPCRHRGYCHNNIGSYRCMCLEGWTGEEHCNVKQNNTDTHRCTPGWMGDDCQDQCLNNSMCQNQGVCEKKKHGREPRQLHCVCAPGWTGLNCTTDIDECPSKACPDNYICINTQGSYHCNCLSGWKGINCSVDIDECIANPCQHSSICENAPGYYNCTCSDGWKGVHCSEDNNEYISNVRRTYTIVGIALCSLLFGFSITTLIGIIKFKSGKVRGNTTMSVNKPRTNVQQIVHNQRYMHTERPPKQCNQPNYRLNQQQTLQLHVHVHPPLQSQLKEKNGQRVSAKIHPKNNKQQNAFNKEREYNDQQEYLKIKEKWQLESVEHYDSKAEQEDAADLENYQNQEERQDRELQQDEQQQQEEEEHRPKYWLQKLNRYFMRITNPLWRY